MMNLRQTLEAGAAAAFALANPDITHFAKSKEDGTLDPSQTLTNARYRWLAEHYPAGSSAIKQKKALINLTATHASVVSASQTFQVNEKGDRIDAPFFDLEDEYHVKADLWLISTIALELMDLLYGVNLGRNVIEFDPNFEKHLTYAASVNADLHSEMTSTERYKRAARKFLTDGGD